jgi:hypothetical protein
LVSEAVLFVELALTDVIVGLVEISLTDVIAGTVLFSPIEV